jgi:hypothetical protein
VTDSDNFGYGPTDSKRALTKEQCIREIMDIMVRNEWVRGVTGPRLAPVYGRSESTLRDYAAEASNRLKFTDEEIDDIRAQWHAKVIGAQVEARRSKQFRALGQLLQLEGTALGLLDRNLEREIDAELRAELEVILDVIGEVLPAEQADQIFEAIARSRGRAPEEATTH